MVSNSLRLSIVGVSLILSAILMFVLFYVVKIIPMDGAIKWVIAAVIATDVVMGLGFLARGVVKR